MDTMMVTLWWFYMLTTSGEYQNGPFFSDQECAVHRQWAVSAVKVQRATTTEKAELLVSPCTHFSVKQF